MTDRPLVSVWSSLETLRAFVYTTGHVQPTEPPLLLSAARG